MEMLERVILHPHLTGTAIFRVSAAESLAVAGGFIAGAAIMFGVRASRCPPDFNQFYMGVIMRSKKTSIRSLGMAAIGASLAFAGVKGAQNDAIICSTHC